MIGESEEIQKERNTIHTDAYGRVKVRINLYAAQEVMDNARVKKQRGASKSQDNKQCTTKTLFLSLLSLS